MLATLFLIVGLGCVFGNETRDVNAKLMFKEVWETSVLLELNPNDVPNWVKIVHISGMEIIDLTGNQWEEGEKYAYAPALPEFLYSNLDKNREYKFRVRFSENGEHFTDWGCESEVVRTKSGREEIRKIKRSWSDAKRVCESEGMRLAIIKNKALNSMLKTRLAEEGIDEAWIGLYDANFGNNEAETCWTWVDGSKLKFKFHQFVNGYVPKTSDLTRSAVVLASDGEWENISPSEKRDFICQREHEVKIRDDEAINAKAVLKAN